MSNVQKSLVLTCCIFPAMVHLPHFVLLVGKELKCFEKKVKQLFNVFRTIRETAYCGDLLWCNTTNVKNMHLHRDSNPGPML